jgi:type II secretory pathway pseudopilin PulG
VGQRRLQGQRREQRGVAYESRGVNDGRKLTLRRHDVAAVQGETVDRTTPQTSSNLWIIRLDAEGRCTEFTEWWMQHPASDWSTAQAEDSSWVQPPDMLVASTGRASTSGELPGNEQTAPGSSRHRGRSLAPAIPCSEHKSASAFQGVTRVRDRARFFDALTAMRGPRGLPV